MDLRPWILLAENATWVPRNLDPLNWIWNWISPYFFNRCSNLCNRLKPILQTWWTWSLIFICYCYWNCRPQIYQICKKITTPRNPLDNYYSRCCPEFPNWQCANLPYNIVHIYKVKVLLGNSFIQNGRAVFICWSLVLEIVFGEWRLYIPT